MTSYLQDAKLFTNYNQDCEKAFESHTSARNKDETELHLLSASANTSLSKYYLERWVEPKSPSIKQITERKAKNN